MAANPQSHPQNYPPQQTGAYPGHQPSGYPPPQQGYYPPQQGYPPPQQGYPPPQQGYPPPQQGYPPPQQGYPQAGYPGHQVGYAAGPQQVIIQQAPVTIQPVALGSTPISMSCYKCHSPIVTKTQHVPGNKAFIHCCLISCLCPFGCCLIPFCMDSCMDVVHRCPNCDQEFGKYTLSALGGGGGGGGGRRRGSYGGDDGGYDGGDGGDGGDD